MNNAVFSTILFTVVNNIVQDCYTRLGSKFGQQNIAQACYTAQDTRGVLTLLWYYSRTYYQNEVMPP